MPKIRPKYAEKLNLKCSENLISAQKVLQKCSKYNEQTQIVIVFYDCSPLPQRSYSRPARYHHRYLSGS